MDIEKEPFLPSAQPNGRASELSQLEHDNASNKPTGRFRIRLYHHVILLLLYTTAVYMYFRCRTSTGGPQNALGINLNWSPKNFVDMNKGHFAGPPGTPGVDQSWHNLLENIHIRVTDAELRKVRQHSVTLPNGGNLVWLGVTHELHCLKMLRKSIYRDDYYANMTESEKHHQETHLEHCVELLRQSAMCHGDMSLSVFQWNPEKSKPELSVRPATRSCINWDVMQTRLHPRVVKDEEMQSLTNPLSPDLTDSIGHASDQDDTVQFPTFDRYDMDSDGYIVYPDVYMDTENPE